MKISVVIPTYNPDAERLASVLNALAVQTLSHEAWECLIVDNASEHPVDSDWCHLKAGRSIRVLYEPNQGLSYARLAGVQDATADIIIFCDDDNVLTPDYLKLALQKMEKNPMIGIAGGKSLPDYLVPPPSWYVERTAPIGCRDLGDTAIMFLAEDFHAHPRYPDCSPIGAGMVCRKEALVSWAASVGKTGILDRKGKSLSSAGDCDMVLHSLCLGFDVVYYPELILHHLIPAQRLTRDYLQRIARVSYRDFIRVLDIHGIRPWSPIHPATIPLRAAKAWVTHRVWKGPRERIRWQSAIGQFEGRAQLNSQK